MSFLKFLFDIFKFDSNSPYSKLKKLKKEIKNFSPKYYNPGKAIFYGTFAHDLYSLYISCQYFEKPLAHLFLNKKVLNTTLLLLLNIYLPKEVIAYIAMLEKERVDDVIKKYGFEKTEKYYQKMVEQIKNYLKPNIVKEIDNFIDNMKQLYELTTYNFNDLFFIFNPAYNSAIVKKSLNFNDIKVSTRFISALEDLSFLIANLSFNDSITTPLIVYLKKYSEKDPTFEFNESKIKKEVTKIVKIINEKFNFDKLEKFLQSLKEQIDYKIKIIPHNDTFVRKLINEKIKQTTDYLISCKNNEKIKNIQNTISSLFPDITMIKSEIYNDEVSTHFSSNLFPPLSFVKPLEIFKTFIVYYWEGKIKGALNLFIFKAQYQDDNIKEAINNSFHEGSNFIDKFNELEASFEELKKYYNILQKKPETLAKSNSQKNNTLATISKVNNDVLSYINEGLSFLTMLGNTLNSIIEQISNKDQSKIINLLSIIDTVTLKNYKFYLEKIIAIKNLIASLINQ